ncbi:hypothetical protein [Pseudomonas profundi]|uniref:hypothetical protein n=1 Tax=Pseudomonas profundi TaxID=1981513 RepID=UPI00123878DC|nr:hypothetical protein [Pseudomonas profundi]
MDRARKAIRFRDLPAEIRLETSRPTTTWINLISCAGVTLMILGVISLIFGPDRDYYTETYGFDFVQFFQVFPGRLLCIGIVLTGAGSALDFQALNAYRNALQDELDGAIDIDEDAIPQGFVLALAQKSENSYRISLIRHEAASAVQPVQQPAPAEQQ